MRNQRKLALLLATAVALGSFVTSAAGTEGPKRGLARATRQLTPRFSFSVRGTGSGALGAKTQRLRPVLSSATRNPRGSIALRRYDQHAQHWDYLTSAIFSEHAEPILSGFLRDLKADGATLTDEDFGKPGRLPKDPFLREVAQRVTELFEMSPGTQHVAGVLSDLLAEVSRGSRVDVRQFGAKWGPRAHALVEDLKRISHLTAGDQGFVERRRSLLAGRTLPGQRQPIDPTGDMLALRSLTASKSAGLPLKGVRVIGVQHLLGSTLGLVDGLLVAGVEPEHINLIGKVYSENVRAIDELKDRGITVQRLGNYGEPDTEREGDKVLRERLERFVRGLRADKDQTGKILVIDDGARLIKMIHAEYPELLGRVVAVEQTRRGVMELEGMRLRCPVVNVAESWAKRTYEAPLIGRSIVVSLDHKLDRLRQAGVDPGRRVLLLGYGTVGRATARELRNRGYTVETFDPSAAALKNAQTDGVHTYATLEEALTHGHIVISATGRTTINTENAHLLPDGAIVANAASSNDEIDPHLHLARGPDLEIDAGGHITDIFRGKRVPLGFTDDPGGSDRVLPFRSGKQIMILQHGYVLNFSGERDPIPPRYIQLTRGLLYLGALQAAHENTPGLVPLAEKDQHILVDGIREQLARTHESLEHPSFD